MKLKRSTLNQILSSVVMVGGLSQMATAELNVPRGADVEPLAANCGMGPFPQTSKAGSYNSLCNIMQDSEKCLAFVKGHFNFDGQTVTFEPTHSVEKASYCLSVLKRDLGLGND